MAQTSRFSKFVTGLGIRRKEVQQGPAIQDLIKLAQDQGYNLMATKSGELVPVPQDMDEREINTLQNRWSGIEASSSDLVNNRITRLGMYKKMDRSGGEGAIVLDTLADEIVNITDYTEQSLQIKISDEKIRNDVFEILHNNNVLENIRSDVRSLCKYGDFGYVLTKPTGNKLIDLAAEEVAKGTMLKLPYAKNDIKINYVNSEMYELTHSNNKLYEMQLGANAEINKELHLKDDTYYPWEYALFSVGSRDTFPYGMSELEKMRLPWEKLSILEELLAITRANRLEKIAITVPGLKGDPTSVLARLSQLKNSIRNIVLGFNSTSSRISRNQDTGLTEYLWIPEGFDAKKLSTSIEVSSIEDVEYFRDKVINASRMPKGFFLASEGQGAQRPMSLRQQDIKFARSLIPISEAYSAGLKKLITLIIFYLGHDINSVKVNVTFKKSPYITSELLETYDSVYKIIQQYKELKGSFSESKEITDIDVKRLLDLMGAPHVLIFPEQEGKDSLKEDYGRIVRYESIAHAMSIDL
jgi:hypothetical protein